MQPEAIIIPAVSVAALATGVSLLMRQARDAQPDRWFSGIGVKFQGGSDSSMVDVDIACHAIVDIIKSDYPAAYSTLIPHMWVYFYGPSDPITSASNPSGKVYHPDGTPAVLMGTSDQVRVTPFSPKVFLSKVRDRKPGETRARPAGTTALFHEVGQHIIPFVTSGDWNVNHIAKWMLVDQKMQDRYKMLGGSM